MVAITMDPAPKDNGLKKLEFLFLVSKVYMDLETHLGFGDKTLTEFIIYLGRKCETVDEFDMKLKQDGTEMPDYFVRTLLTTIRAILSPKPKAEKDSKKESASNGPKHSAPVISGNRDRIRQYQPTEQELFKVYKGMVLRVMDTGCFVQLNALKSKG
jgi:ATP-dependent RNA helicase DHX8/PRP22